MLGGLEMCEIEATAVHGTADLRWTQTGIGHRFTVKVVLSVADFSRI